MDYDTLMKQAAEAENLSFLTRDGWGEDADDASRLLDDAAAKLYRAAFTHKVRTVLDALEMTNGNFLHEDSTPEQSYLRDGENLNFDTYALTRSSRRVGDYLHLTIAVAPENRQSVINALLANGLVDGWNGSEEEFEEAHSRYGWIAVRTEEKQHPDIR